MTIELGCGRIKTRREEVSNERGITISADPNKKYKKWKNKVGIRLDYFALNSKKIIRNQMPMYSYLI